MNLQSCIYNSSAGQVLQITPACIQSLIGGAITLALSLAGTVALFFIISAGITFITSGGGKQVEQAKNTLTYAVIGLVLVLLSFFIVNLLGYISGVTCFFRGSC